jgi:hypothetical protein
VTAVAASDWTIARCLFSALAMPKKFIAPPKAETDDKAMVELQSLCKDHRRAVLSDQDASKVLYISTGIG